MLNSKHDLSFHEAKLDYAALTRVAEIAYVAMKHEIERYQNELRDDDLTNAHTARYLDANWLKQAAKNLAVAAETYSSLKEGETREIIRVINKPALKKAR